MKPLPVCSVLLLAPGATPTPEQMASRECVAMRTLSSIVPAIVETHFAEMRTRFDCDAKGWWLQLGLEPRIQKLLPLFAESDLLPARSRAACAIEREARAIRHALLDAQARIDECASVLIASPESIHQASLQIERAIASCIVEMAGRSLFVRDRDRAISLSFPEIPKWMADADTTPVAGKLVSLAREHLILERVIILDTNGRGDRGALPISRLRVNRNPGNLTEPHTATLAAYLDTARPLRLSVRLNRCAFTRTIVTAALAGSVSLEAPPPRRRTGGRTAFRQPNAIAVSARTV
jgi:hypothetical protein